MMSGQLTRRDFLSSSTKTAAAVTLGSYWARTALADTRKIGANDRIVVALIGAGGRGSEDCRQACRSDNVICAAVADLASFRLAENVPTIQKAMEKNGAASTKIDTYGDYRKLLDRKDIDAIIIGTPDHWHLPVFIAGLEAGKHVYQEKPMSKSIEESNKMLAAAQKHPKLTVQIGTQRRSGPHYLKAKALLDEGKIGEIKFARCYDCRNWVTGRDSFAPRPGIDPKTIDWNMFQEPCDHKVEYEPHRYFAWRWFWDYANGLLTDVGVHVLDVVHWLTNKDTPKSVVCNGGVYGLKYWETPDIVNAVWDYGSHSVAFTSNFTNQFQGSGLTLYGTKGTLEITGNDIKIWEGDPGKVAVELPSESTAYDHHANWIDCIRSGKKTNAPVELGAKSLLPLHLATMAYRQGKKITWDAEAQKAIAV